MLLKPGGLVAAAGGAAEPPPPAAVPGVDAEAVLDVTASASTWNLPIAVNAGNNRRLIIQIGHVTSNSVTTVSSVTLGPGGANRALAQVGTIIASRYTRLDTWELREVDFPAPGTYTLRTVLSGLDQGFVLARVYKNVSQDQRGYHTTTASNTGSLTIGSGAARYPATSLLLAALLESQGRSNWTVTGATKHREATGTTTGDAAVWADAALAAEAAPSVRFDNAQSASRLAAAMVLLLPVGGAPL